MADDKGWFSVHRKLLEGSLWLDEPFTRGQAWVDLLGLANHKRGWFTHRGIRVVVERGQVGYSMKALAIRWQWSRGKVRRFLEMLENEHQIEHQITKLTTLITIVNYHEYQDKRTSKRTSNGHQTDTNNNDNNGNNKRTHTGPAQIAPFRQIIQPDFYPTDETVEYCRARRLPDPCDQVMLDDFINSNLSKNWESANWQAEYRKFIPKWRTINERFKNADGRNRSERMLDAIRNLPDN